MLQRGVSDIVKEKEKCLQLLLKSFRKDNARKTLYNDASSSDLFSAPKHSFHGGRFKTDRVVEVSIN